MSNETPLYDLTSAAVQTLKRLIAIPSFSKKEGLTAEVVQTTLEDHDIFAQQIGNNIFAQNEHFSDSKPTILLNSHHDTVKPATGWIHDPFTPVEENGKLFGLGSNDAGAALVCLLYTFIELYDRDDLPFNLVFVASAEEEISGKNGIAHVLTKLPTINLGIVGEPTSLRMAIAEKGLMVIDAKVVGESGHAARNEGINAIYLAVEDIQKLNTYQFRKESPTLGTINLNVTQINAGTQHNVVPDQCTYVIDVRTHEKYSNEQIFKELQSITHASLEARSFRLNSSGIALDHPLVRAGIELGLPYYGSPTLSDQALMNGFPTLKIGPGESARSHTADEFVYLSELEAGLNLYLRLLEAYANVF
jgi:acetylornithine deacetylase